VNVERLIDDSRPFLSWLVSWYNDRPDLDLGRVVEELGGADKVAVLAVDVTVGFCSEGALSSVRVGGIVRPITRLFERVYGLGVRHFVLPQDTHSPDAVEFGSYPPHCVRGSEEAMTVPELRNLEFSDLFVVMEKDSISVDINTGLDEWLESHPEVTTYIVVGDCTDICVYQLAMHLRLRANALKQRDVRVIVPIDGVNTYDTPVSAAQEIGAMPHEGDLLHLIFLYSMALNGVEVVASAV
jgi:nicotinamidase-related amidase